MSDQILCLAPGEGSTPTNATDAESQCFPALFPSATNTFIEKRNTKISYNRYLNCRLLSCDNRFSSCPEYIFWGQYNNDVNSVASALSISMRKNTGKTSEGIKITKEMLLGKESLKKLLQKDEAYKSLQTIRGSPPYWEKTLKDLFAMLRQLGIPTWFCSFSAADRRWPEIIEAICSQQHQSVPENLSWEAYCKIIASNPVTAARVFDQRVHHFLNDIIKSKSQPIGEVEDFFFRTEFQMRGIVYLCIFVP